jgi:hypothetical protein
MTDIPLLPEFLHFLTTGEDPAGAIAPHLHAEFNFPNTYFAIEGNVAFKTLRDQVSEDEWKFTVERAEPTPHGFVVEGPHEETAIGGGLVRSRTLSLVTVHSSQITEVVHYCTGAV